MAGFNMQVQNIRPLDFSGLTNAIAGLGEKETRRKRNELLDMQIEDAKLNREIKKQSNVLAKEYANANNDTKDSVFKQWVAVDPQGATIAIQAYDAMDASKQKETLNKAQKLYSHINSVMNNDGTLNTEAYNLKAPAYGLPLVDGVKVTSQSVMQELKQAEMQIIGIQEYAKGRNKTANEKEIINERGKRDKELEAFKHQNDMELEKNKARIKTDGLDAKTKEQISFNKSKINSLTQQLNNTFDKDERAKLGKEIKFYTDKTRKILGDNEIEEDIITPEPEGWEIYLD